MSTTREIRVGKVSGKSSYELAVELGTFSGTLSEYVNKEQQTYNDMVVYGDALKTSIEALVSPRFEFTTAASAEAYVVANTSTELYRKQMTYGVYASLSAFVILEAVTPVNDGVMEVYVNGSLVFATSIVNNVANLNVNLELETNDEVVVTMTQKSSVNRAVSNSAFNMLTFERS